jgi:hypothetical protein
MNLTPPETEDNPNLTLNNFLLVVPYNWLWQSTGDVSNSRLQQGKV